jgi:hypothetical protein
MPKCGYLHFVWGALTWCHRSAPGPSLNEVRAGDWVGAAPYGAEVCC